MGRGGNMSYRLKLRRFFISLPIYMRFLLKWMIHPSNATSVGVRLIRRRSQFSRRRLLSKNAAPFIHYLYLIYARKFDVRSHGKITRQWKKNPNPRYN